MSVDKFDRWLGKLKWPTVFGWEVGPAVWSRGIDLKTVPLIGNEFGRRFVRIPFTRYTINVERVKA